MEVSTPRPDAGRAGGILEVWRTVDGRVVTHVDPAEPLRTKLSGEGATMIAFCRYGEGQHKTLDEAHRFAREVAAGRKPW